VIGLTNGEVLPKYSRLFTRRGWRYQRGNQNP